MKFELGIIGAGVMANALLSKIIEKNVLSPKDMTIYDIDSSKCKAIDKDINVSTNIQQLIDNSKAVLFAVKPQNYKAICDNNKFRKDLIVISIMAGVKISTLRAALGVSCGILRIMPNMPCKIGEGICALCFSDIEKEEKEFLSKLFEASGQILEINEEHFDAVTSVSGSGPAYVYMFLQGMIKGGINGGLTYCESEKLALATLKGAAGIVANSNEDLDTMVQKVCSKGGTTIEAVNIYREKQLVDIIAEGIDACRKRSEELSKLL